MTLWERLAVVHLIAIVRTTTFEAAVTQAESLIAAGVGVLEVSCTTPDALRVIPLVKKAGVLVGAGTVLSEATAVAAIEAGAEFLLAPNYSGSVHAVSMHQDIPYIPGVWTPSDVASALEAGLSVQKLFPASIGGIAHMKALSEPFPTVKFVPTGGVTGLDAEDWIHAGALAVGMGGSLARMDGHEMRKMVERIRVRTIEK